MKQSARTAALLLSLSAVSYAADGDDTSKKPAAPAAAAKKERKVDPTAEKALERHIGLVAYPQSTGIKELAAKGDFAQGGETIGVNPKWASGKGFDFEVTLPEAIIKDAEAKGKSPEEATMIAKQQLSPFLVTALGANSAFEPPGKNWRHFDLAARQQGDEQIVELTPFDDEADAAGRKYVFGKDGLLKSSTFNPKQRPDFTLEVTWTYEKRGARSVLAGRTLTTPDQKLEVKFTYFDGPGGSALLKEATLSVPQGEQLIRFHDYTVDGKLVESTKAPAAEAKNADKPPEPASPPAPASK